MNDTIKIRGARQHNLKNIDLDIPKNKLVIFTGVSGSGKSSLAFDTIYAEGQRRYVESLSSYARQFLGIMEKPDVDLIEGLSPAISIDQKTTSNNPRSTVGTITEIYDYLRLLFARIGHPHCPICGREISRQSVDQIVGGIMNEIKKDLTSSKRTWFLILSPIVVDRKGEFSTLFENLRAKGYRQVRIDGHIKDLSEDFVLIKTNKHTVEAVIDRISVNQKDFKNVIYHENLKSRLSDSVQQALNISEGLVTVASVLDEGFVMPDYPKEFQNHLYSERFACPVDNISLPEIEPRSFSFNSPQGACEICDGIGKILKVEPNLVFSPEITITEGGILPFSNMFENDTWYSRLILKVCEVNGINPKVQIKNLSNDSLELLLKGTRDKVYTVAGTNRFGRNTYIEEVFLGIIPELEKRYRETESDWVREEIKKYMREKVCPGCGGARLKKEALGVTIDKLSIADVSAFSITDCLGWAESLSSRGILNQAETQIGQIILKEIVGRLNFLKSVGIEYLTLGREAGTLSGGEAQRIRLASQIGSGLTGVLYVLDEPTIGLHQRDNRKLIKTLKNLRDLGNSVIVVEHDREMMEESDYLIDFGPGAGKGGGEIIAEGTSGQIKRNPKSVTGKFLSGARCIDVGAVKKTTQKQNYIQLYGCTQFNLKDIDVKIPLGKLVLITGVSGSGKSSLLVETLYPALRSSLDSSFRGEVPKLTRFEGKEFVDKVVLIDQSPIGRTPRSNPATYTGLFSPIRDIFAATSEARGYGFKKGRFSFNVKGGRCENCEGQGQIKIEMQFMSDIWVKCDVCQGARYNAQTMEIAYKGKNIAEVLEMTLSEAVEFFHAHPQIINRLETLSLVGLGYIELGQPATTLSGGEAQRVKLATELSKKATGKTVYVLDEPTTGLHFSDTERLLKVLRLLVDKGNTVIVIEHNLDVIKNADWIIDLGPEGGDSGGKIVAEGTPKDLSRVKSSYTGQFLRNII